MSSSAYIRSRITHLKANATMIACSSCRLTYPADQVPYRCPKCGGIFDFETLPPLDRDRIDTNLPGIWRYRHVFNLTDDTPIVSLGEGQTPLVWGEAFGIPTAFKLEFLNPTGSYKDRGSAVLASFLTSRGVREAIEDSSGNAGSSFAAYAARAGLQARIFIPDSTSGPKRRQIEAYGAQAVRIMGPRSNAAQAAQRAALQGAVYASHAYLPQGLAGYATLAFELFEQLGKAPGTVIVPVGQGNLLLALGRGFLALQQAGLIAEIPHLVGVQARNCAPLWAAADERVRFELGTAGIDAALQRRLSLWVNEGDSVAEGVRVKYPLRGDAVLRFLSTYQGKMVAVDEEAILPARDELARKGFYVEPTSALVWDALRQLLGADDYIRNGSQIPQPIVLILTGSGLKSLI